MSHPPLPTFRYHPDPVATGAFEPSLDQCPHCGVVRTYVYRGPVYAIEQPEPPCPACIADGSFAARFDADFTDPYPLSGLDVEVIEHVARRTPGFGGWQQARWLAHCGDAAAFLGAVGYEELASHPSAMAHLMADLAFDRRWDDGHINEYVRALSRDGPPTAYLFRCLHCATGLAYSDED